MVAQVDYFRVIADHLGITNVMFDMGHSDVDTDHSFPIFDTSVAADVPPFDDDAFP